MPFGLKNARATYQQMMTRMFRDKIRRMVEVYIDDMVVKSKQEVRHIKDLHEVFEVLWQHKLCLTNQGIKVNPNQIEVVNCLKPPRNPKEVQVLTGMLVALNQFISKFTDCCRPFYQLLKNGKDFSGIRNGTELFEI